MFTVKLKGLEELQKKMEKSPQVIEKVSKDKLLEAGKIIYREEVQEAPAGKTGHLRQQIQYKYSPIQVVIKPNAEYSKFVHDGTKPHWTSVKNLEGWAKLKGINPYAVQRAIAKKGTKANKFVERAYKNTKGRAEKILNKILKEVIEKL